MALGKNTTFPCIGILLLLLLQGICVTFTKFLPELGETPGQKMGQLTEMSTFFENFPKFSREQTWRHNKIMGNNFRTNFADFPVFSKARSVEKTGIFVARQKFSTLSTGFSTGGKMWCDN